MSEAYLASMINSSGSIKKVLLLDDTYSLEMEITSTTSKKYNSFISKDILMSYGNSLEYDYVVYEIDISYTISSYSSGDFSLGFYRYTSSSSSNNQTYWNRTGTFSSSGGSLDTLKWKYVVNNGTKITPSSTSYTNSISFGIYSGGVAGTATAHVRIYGYSLGIY